MKKTFYQLRRKLKNIAVVGPMADNGAQLSGSYAPPYNPNVTITPLNGVAPLAKNIRHARGCDDLECKAYNRTEVVKAIDETNLIIVCLGTGSAPVILLLVNAGPVVSDQFSHVDAILECFYPGQQAGEALLKILKGEENPAGRLPFTWPESLDQVPEMTNYSMANRTYRYWDHPASPLYPFGYGLSYTRFTYDELKLDETSVKVGNDVNFYVTVANVGDYDGDEVIQAYISWANPREPMPNLQFVVFDRVRIVAGSRVRWRGKISAYQMAVYLDSAGFRVMAGDFHLYVGGQQPHQRVTVHSNVLRANFTLREKV